MSLDADAVSVRHLYQGRLGLPIVLIVAVCSASVPVAGIRGEGVDRRR